VGGIEAFAGIDHQGADEDSMTTSLEGVTEEKCQNCAKNPAQPKHTCPYAEEIGGDRESLCNCCDDCSYQCAMDV
jgi:hypothetical protein